MNDEMQGAANNETDELLRELWRQALTEIEAIKPGRSPEAADFQDENLVVGSILVLLLALPSCFACLVSRRISSRANEHFLK